MKEALVVPLVAASTSAKHVPAESRSPQFKPRFTRIRAQGLLSTNLLWRPRRTPNSILLLSRLFQSTQCP